jgi:hypothetical protein
MFVTMFRRTAPLSSPQAALSAALFLGDVMVKLGLLAAALIATPVFASSPGGAVPAPTVHITASNYNNVSSRNCNTHVDYTLTCGRASAVSSLAGTPFVSLTSSLADGDYAESIIETLTYGFSLSGSGSDVVPLHALVKVATSTTGFYPYDVYASVGISNPTSSTGAGVRGNDSFEGVLDFTATAGDINTVTLYASIALYCCDDAIGTRETAYADPFFYIDADYLAAHPGVRLNFGEGVGNLDPNAVASVPEPASWGLMVAGFGLVGGTMRRRSTRLVGA